jgi:hypothetical protein
MKAKTRMRRPRFGAIHGNTCATRYITSKLLFRDANLSLQNGQTMHLKGKLRVGLLL